MSLPDFDRAQYGEVLPPAGNPGGYTGDFRPSRREGAFVQALLFGTVAAIAGSVVYAAIGLSGFMVSIVAIGVALLIGKAMMTATGGVGGQPYQIAAVVLTYLAVSLADVLDLIYYAHRNESIPVGEILAHNLPLLLKYLLLGPFLEVRSGVNGILGLVIIAIGMRTAWRAAAGGPGFGQGSRQRVGPFGMR